MLRISCCAALLAAGLFGVGSVPPAKAAEHEHSAHMVACSKICASCQTECDFCFAHCKRLVLEGRKEHAAAMELCVDCADCCKLSATLTARLSPLSMDACECCAKCCEKCAAECEKHNDDKQMMQCAKSCRDCAKSCREMIEHMKK